MIVISSGLTAGPPGLYLGNRNNRGRGLEED